MAVTSKHFKALLSPISLFHLYLHHIWFQQAILRRRAWHFGLKNSLPRKMIDIILNKKIEAMRIPRLQAMHLPPQDFPSSYNVNTNLLTLELDVPNWSTLKFKIAFHAAGLPSWHTFALHISLSAIWAAPATTHSLRTECCPRHQLTSSLTHMMMQWMLVRFITSWHLQLQMQNSQL